MSGPESPELWGADEPPGSRWWVAEGPTAGRAAAQGGLAELRCQGTKAFPGEWEDVMAEMLKLGALKEWWDRAREREAPGNRATSSPL